MPTTAFEDSDSDYPEWTSLSEELKYLQRLTSTNSRMGFRVGGLTHSGKPIYEVRIGYPGVPTDDELRDKQTMFIVGLPHGNEPSGREATFQFMRFLSESEDPDITGFLTKHPVLIVPTHNADGFPTSRLDGAGNDLNRQYLAYPVGGARVIGSILAKYRPPVMIDCHEHWAGAANDFESNSVTNNSAAPAVRTQAQTLYTAMRSAWLAAGYAVRSYAGGINATIARNNVGLRNRICLLIEATDQSYAGAMTRKQAVAGYMIAFKTALTWHNTQSETTASIIKSADKQTVSAGKARTPILVPAITPPLGYRLTQAQYNSLAVSLRLLRIRSNVIAGSTDRYVSMGQESGRLIPAIMDAASVDKLITAEHMNTSPELQREAVFKSAGGSWEPSKFIMTKSSRLWRVVDGGWQ